MGPRRGPPGGERQIDATRFLRGVQLTGQEGVAEFATVYPGWYIGRAIHIHLKVHLGGHVSHTGQLFFPEEVTADVAKLAPYAARLQVHRTLQSEDHVFNEQHGAASMTGLSRLRNSSNADGFLATVTLAVDPDASPAAVHGFGRR
jgi:protocatechuate 3,4-dioxygenase beta subunit